MQTVFGYAVPTGTGLADKWQSPRLFGYLLQNEAQRLWGLEKMNAAPLAKCAIMNFKKGRNTIKPRTLRKLTKPIRELQNNSIKN